jgi:hypothetical protein
MRPAFVESHPSTVLRAGSFDRAQGRLLSQSARKDGAPGASARGMGDSCRSRCSAGDRSTGAKARFLSPLNAALKGRSSTVVTAASQRTSVTEFLAGWRALAPSTSYALALSKFHLLGPVLAQIPSLTRSRSLWSLQRRGSASLQAGVSCSSKRGVSPGVGSSWNRPAAEECG